MYVIIEKSRGRLYSYRESQPHFDAAEPQRKHLKRLPQKVLDNECDLADLPDESYVVFKMHQSKPATKPKKKKKPRVS